MNYEQKYKDALSRARSMYESQDDAELAAYIFPELRESEDERIRRTLVEYFGPKAQLDFVRGVPIQKIRDWLEKQKEPQEIPLMNGDADLYFDEWNQQNQNPTKRQCFEEGMKYAQMLQKEQMLKDAVEGEVMTNGFYPYEPRIVAPYPNCPYTFGDKVRIIVLKAEEE